MLAPFRAGGPQGIQGRAPLLILLPPDLWVHIETNAGMVYFFDEEQTQRSDGSSVVYCRGNTPRQSDRLAACERQPGVTARGIGLITTER